MLAEIQRLQKIDDILYSVLNQLNVSLVNPENLDQEKRRFFSSQRYNPLFYYKDAVINFSDCYNKLSRMRFGNTIMDGILRQKASEALCFLKMIESRGRANFVHHSIEIYGKPTKRLLEHALYYSKKNPGKIYERSTHSSKQAIQIFRRTLNALGFNWKLECKDIVANALVIPSERTFILKKNYKFTERKIKRLIAHEIFGHILRAECGLLQPYRIFSVGFPGYEPAEEGLALFKEKIAGLLDDQSLKGYAGRVLATHVALNYSFRKTYTLLRKFYSRDQAWNLAVRVKRGLEDTSKPGAFTKDLVYLKGLMQVSRYHAMKGSLKLLHFGKVSVEHTDILGRIPGIADPGTLINSFKNPGAIPHNLLW
jgi:uncharacterized protein (TIGR02421 family)